jgi:magnesium-transporting ATPase (P-type)
MGLAGLLGPVAWVVRGRGRGRDAVPGISRRRAWARDGRVSVLVPEAAGVAAAQIRKQIETDLASHPGVEWVAVNAPLERVVVGVGGTGASPVEPSPGEIVSAVETAIARAGRPPADRGTGQPSAGQSPEATGPVVRGIVTMAADALAVGFATTGRVLRWIPLPGEVLAVALAVDSQPRLRSVVERTLGQSNADLALGLGNAVIGGLSQSVAGLMVDATLRLAQVREAGQQRRCWQEREPDLLGTDRRAAAGPVVAERPRPLPPGPYERHARWASAASAAGLVAGTVTGSPRRGVGFAMGALPRAARVGREAHAAALGHELARRGVLVLQPGVLRLLDRVDAVVLDPQAFRTGRLAVGPVAVLPGAGENEARLCVHRLFRAGSADACVADGRWTLGPVDALPLTGRRGVRESRRLEREGALRVLGLACGRRLMAVVAVVAEPPPALAAVVEAARRAGLTVVLAPADHTGSGDARMLADRVMPGGSRLPATVRELQAEGRVVALVSSRRPALAAADVGVGVDGPDGAPAWGAPVLVGNDLDAAALIVEAAGSARRAAVTAVRLSQAATAASVLAGLSQRGGQASRRAGDAVTGAGALALAQATVAVRKLASRPVLRPAAAPPWHAMPAASVLAELGSDPGGLSGQAASLRREEARIPAPRTAGLLRAFAEELSNPLTPILAGGAALSASVGSALDAGLVLAASGVSALTGSVQRLSTDRAVAGLFARAEAPVRVRRGGEQLRLRTGELVVGDVVLLGPGDVVPADARVIEASGLEVDESALTGESLPVAKSPDAVLGSAVAERSSMVYEGTTVAAGRAAAAVTALGGWTEVGRGLALAQDRANRGGVEARLTGITRVTVPVAVGSAAAVVAAGLVRAVPMRDTVAAGVALAVASVPEGLPLLVGAAQLAAARRLGRLGSLVRNPATIEALGRVDVLCFDKTGTLTEGAVRLTAVSDGLGSAPLPDLDERLRAVVATGLRATPRMRGGAHQSSLTDRAVLDAAHELGIQRRWGLAEWSRQASLPFEPSRGFHATFGAAGDKPLVCVKGAPEAVLPRCATWRAGNDLPAPLDPAARAALTAELERLGSQGYRVLAVAEGDGPAAAVTDGSAAGRRRVLGEAVSGLEFRGFLALSDPVRPGAAPALVGIRDAGVHVVMITGDHPATAAAVARGIGVLDHGLLITGAELDAMDDAALDALLPQVTVVARGTPHHKVRVVRGFQRLGRAVAMTGDGANDAPAIRLADVGIALGRRGTPAARAAADLVVTDDRLETIISALVEGRSMWSSVRQALGILLGGNLGEIVFTVLVAALTGRPALNARQLLLVNLLTDLAPALAVALRPPAPPARAQALAQGVDTMGAALDRDIALRAATTTAGACAAWTLARLTGRAKRANTVALVALVGTQLGQTLAVGGRSPAVVGASVGSMAVLAGAVQTPGVSGFFGCTPLGPVGWTIAGGSAAAATLLVPPLADRLAPVLYRGWSLVAARVPGPRADSSALAALRRLPGFALEIPEIPEIPEAAGAGRAHAAAGEPVVDPRGPLDADRLA